MSVRTIFSHEQEFAPIKKEDADKNFKVTFEVAGSKRREKDAQRAFGEGGVKEAVTAFFLERGKDIVKAASYAAKAVELAIPDTPAGVSAGYASTVTGHFKCLLSVVVDGPKKLVEIYDGVISLVTPLPDGTHSVSDVAWKIGELVCKKLTDLTNVACDAVVLLDHYFVQLGPQAMKTLKGVGGVAVLVGSLYGLVFENCFTLRNYLKAEGEECPTGSECAALGLGFAQNTCFVVLGALLIATGIAGAIILSSWVIFAFSVAGFAFSLGVFFVERIGERSVTPRWTIESLQSV